MSERRNNGASGFDPTKTAMHIPSNVLMDEFRYLRGKMDAMDTKLDDRNLEIEHRMTKAEQKAKGWGAVMGMISGALSSLGINIGGG